MRLAELDSLDEMRLLALDHLRVQKMRIARAYNKKVKPQSFVLRKESFCYGIRRGYSCPNRGLVRLALSLISALILLDF